MAFQIHTRVWWAGFRNTHRGHPDLKRATDFRGILCETTAKELTAAACDEGGHGFGEGGV